MDVASTTAPVDLTEAHRVHVARQFPALALLNMAATLVWVVSLGWSGEVPFRYGWMTAAAQLLVLAPAAVACRRRPTAPWVIPVAVAAFALAGLSWVVLMAVSAASGLVLSYIVFMLFVGAALGAAWGLAPQIALQAIVTLGWILALPLLNRRLSGPERFAVAGLGSAIALVIAAWAARAFRAEHERRRDEARLTSALAASRDAFRSLTENARDFIWAADLKGRITYVNPAIAHLHAQPADAIVGRTVADLLTDHPDNPPRVLWRPGIARLRAGETLPPMTLQVHAATGPRWVESVISPVKDERGEVIGLQATSRDVTERREAEATVRAMTEALAASLQDLRVSEEKLRFLAQRQVAVREEERKRLGFDLHDDVCQELIGVGILAESVRRRLGSVSADVTTDLERIVRYVTEVVEHLRLLAHELRPMLLHDLGLEGSLRSLVAGLESPAAELHVFFPTPVPRLEEATEVAVYRIAQEALTNAVRHAQAGVIALTLSIAGEALTLEIRDDGCGFDPASRRGRALGLLSMEERALALGGRLEVQSSADAGTVIVLTCPAILRAAVSAA